MGDASEFDRESVNAEVGNLVRRFALQLVKQPDTPAVIRCTGTSSAQSYVTTTFQELGKLVARYAAGLSENGLRSGDRVLMLVPPGEDFLALTYATLMLGALPTFVDPGVGFSKLCKCIETAAPQALIAAPKGFLLKLIAWRGFKRLKLSVMVSDSRLSLGWQTTARLKQAYSSVMEKRLKQLAAEEEGVGDFAGSEQQGRWIEWVAFTSGATGVPKGVIYDRRNVAALLKLLEEKLNYRAGQVDLPLLPIFSIFNVGLGVTSLFPLMDPGRPLELDPAPLLEAAEKFKVSSSFGSPTLWNKIANFLPHPEFNWPASFNRILIAGAPVNEKVLVNLSRVVSGFEEVVFTP